MSDKLIACLSIKGIDMAHEAWELLRLFHDKDNIYFEEDGGWSNHDKTNHLDRDEVPLDAVHYEAVLSEWQAMSTQSDDGVSAAKNGFVASVQVSCGRKLIWEDTFQCAPEEAISAKGFLWSNRKIRIGSSLLQAAERIIGIKTEWGSLTGVRPVKLAHMAHGRGLSDNDTSDLLVSTTKMHLDKAKLLIDIANIQQPVLESQSDKISFYIGIPFCVSRCLYCSFPSWTTDRYGQLVPAYLDALTMELVHAAGLVQQLGKRLDSVYIGGGTPTSLTSEQLNTLLKQLTQHLDITADVEFTVEAGRPDTITPEKLSVMRSNGVNRISINPQTMHAPTLQRIGRNHTPEAIEICMQWAREAGFKTINMDLIAGLPGEDAAVFQQTLADIKRLRPENLTIHTMAVKRASRLNEEKGMHDVAEDDVVSEMIKNGAVAAQQMGMVPYYLYRQKNIMANLENVGYALREHICRYNIQTMEEQQSVIAIGAGSISKRVDKQPPHIDRCMNVRELSHYLERLPEMLTRKEALFFGQSVIQF